MTSSIPLVVGMPVYRRAWVMNDWFDSFESQDPPDGTRLLFGLSSSEDGTEQIIHRRCEDGGYPYEILDVDQFPKFEEYQKGHPARYGILAAIRNVLLRRVVSLSPGAYVSWDSDILLYPGSLRELLCTPEAAVGALLDMGGKVLPGYWSWMRLDGGDAYRPPTTALGFPADRPLSGPFPVGVIMGAKMLRPVAYRNGRYADHILGEDVGFSIALESLGIARWIAPRAKGEHLYRLD